MRYKMTLFPQFVELCLFIVYLEVLEVKTTPQFYLNVILLSTKSTTMEVKYLGKRLSTASCGVWGKRVRNNQLLFSSGVM